MIKLITGNMLDSNADVLVNTVNTVGVMGKGIALQFRKAYPNNFKAYEAACKRGEVAIGKLFISRDSNVASGEKTIVNFPTKKDWRRPSEYSYIEQGLDALVRFIDAEKPSSIAIPPLGAGNGGLDWQKVKRLIESKLGQLDLDVYVYEPSDHVKEHLKKERVKLTPARALLLYVLYDLVSNGEYVSEFSSEKICYFLQRFGAEAIFKLHYEPNFYGPYSGKVRYLLNTLNGSYLMGYSDMDKKPFELLTLVADGSKAVEEFIAKDDELANIASRTKHFLNGFYSDFSLELLSSVDYIMATTRAMDVDVVTRKLEEWSERKSNLAANPKYLEISMQHLEKTFYS